MDEPWFHIRRGCEELADYTLSNHRRIFPYFVLHDHVHARNVRRYSEYLLGLLSEKKQIHATLLSCAAYLHDISLALPVPVLNNLKLHIDEIREDAPELADDVLRSYREYFEDGYLKIKDQEMNKKPEKAASTRKLWRKLHPWISSKYVQKFLPNMEVVVPNRSFFLKLIEPLSTVIKWHSSKAVLGRSYPCRIQVDGYELYLCELALVLRLADAMDFSRKRGKFLYDLLLEEMKSEAPSQLKHWAFKMAVDNVEYRSGTITIDVSTGLGVEAQAKLLGVLLFEVAENFLHDFESFNGLGGGHLGRVGLRLTVNGSTIADLSKAISDIQNRYDCIKRIRLESLGDIGFKALRALSQELGEKEARKNGDFFDSLALALATNDEQAMRSLLQTAVNQCGVDGLLQWVLKPSET